MAIVRLYNLLKMPRERSESIRRSNGRQRSGRSGRSARRSRSRTRAQGSRGSPRVLAADRDDQRDFERRRRTRRSSRVDSQARSRSRSVATVSSRCRTPRAPLISPQVEPTNSHTDCSQVRQRRRRTPSRKSIDKSRSPVRSGINETCSPAPLQPSGNTVNDELLKCIKESLQIISAINPQSKDRYINNNVVPEFDPKSKNQTIDIWLNKVNECSEIYGWDSKQTAHYALPKLVGTAKKWYEGQSSVLLTWDEWVVKLKTAFPSYENYGHLLTEMLAKRAKFGDNLEEYYYEKLIALNRCGITGRNAIDCIVYGIDDRSVRYGAEAVGFEDPDKLLGYLRGVKHERLDKFSKNLRPVTEITRKTIKNDLGRVVKCFNCHEIGHVVSGCNKPIVKCQRCRRVGHDDPKCNKNPWINKPEVNTL